METFHVAFFYDICQHNLCIDVQNIKSLHVSAIMRHLCMYLYLSAFFSVLASIYVWVYFV
jgi:hypothetical protein